MSKYKFELPTTGRRYLCPAEPAGMETASSHPPLQARWQLRAERARDAFGLVLILVLTTYVLASVVSNKGWAAVLLTVSTSATSIVALTSSHARPKVVRRAVLVAGLAIALAMASATFGGRLCLNVASFLEILLLAIAMAAVLQRVLTSDTVSSRTILGAISVYTSLGILFTWAYGLIDRIEGGGFFGEVAQEKGSDFLFFSYTTLTTTGYGDLVPVGQVGRMVSGFEMMLGQVFLVTLVAGLVTLWRPGEGLLRRRERRGEQSPPKSPDAV
jgi:Ion channel